MGGWQVTVADFNGDGISDVLRYRPSDGATQTVTFNGAASVYRAQPTLGTGMTVKRAEFTGDKLADLFLYNPTTGATQIAIMQTSGVFKTDLGRLAGAACSSQLPT